jgi:predicted enzyme related to lactoylglutathione lyase
MDMKLELVAIPVTDVDRAKAFYTDQVGFIAEHDHTVSEETRLRRDSMRATATPGGITATVHRARGSAPPPAGESRG